MSKLNKRLEQTLDLDSPWGRLIHAMAHSDGKPLLVSRPPKVLRYPGFQVQDASLGQRHTWKAEFPWEGKRWLDLLAAQALPKGSPIRVTGYLSESPELRQMLGLQATDFLRSKGFVTQVVVRSSYKTGLFWILEEVLPKLRRAGANGLRLIYPVTPQPPTWRFLQETFPLFSLLETQGIAFESAPRKDAGMAYQAIALKDTSPLWQLECPLPLYQRSIVGGSSVLASTGQLHIQAGNQTFHERIPTDGELFWDWYMDTVLPEVLKRAEGKDHGPFFRNLTVSAQLSEPEVDLGVDQECASMPEALAEEVYFTTLEAFKEQKRMAPQARSQTIGRIVPVIQTRPGQNGHAKAILIENSPIEAEFQPSLSAQGHPQAERMVLHSDPSALRHLYALEAAAALPAWEAALPREVPFSVGGQEGQLPALSGPSSPKTLPPRPLRPREIWQAAYSLSQTLGLNLDVPAYSYDGRPILALSRNHQPEKPGLMVTGGQHANEPTGPKAALQLIEVLANNDALNWVVLPLENPDGNMLHHALMQLAPSHMHHPARYTSLGDDLQARMHQAKPRFEAAGRHWALGEFRPQVHLNLHGYPSHEWARPYSGYSPRGFEAWALPMGVLMVLHYTSVQKQAALELGAQIARALGQETALLRLTQDALKRREAHSHDQPYTLIEGFPFLLWEKQSDQEELIEVITEMPDETLYGQAFEMLVNAQVIVGKTIMDWLQNKHKQQE